MIALIGTRARFHGRRNSRGVTLIELMTVVAILALIASIAVPTYRKYLLRSQRSEAKIALLQLQTAEEKFYMQNNAFTSDIAAASPTGLGIPTTTETGKYTMTVVLGADSQTFTVTAAPKAGGGQTDDTDCANFTIDNRGTRGVSGPKGVKDCWR